MKYVVIEGQVRTLVAEQHPFKRVKNYFIDSVLYKEAYETVVQEEDEFESRNEGNEELTPNLTIRTMNGNLT